VAVEIVHGELDRTARVEGIHATVWLLRDAGPWYSTVMIVPVRDHGLNLTWRGAGDRGPSRCLAAFNTIAAGLTTADDASPR